MIIRDHHGCCFCFNYKSWSLAMQRHHPAPTSRTSVTTRSCFWNWTFSKKKINLCLTFLCSPTARASPHVFFLFLFCVHFLSSKIKGRCSGIFSRVGFRVPNSRREIRGIASLAKLFRSQSYFYLRQKAVIFVMVEKAFLGPITRAALRLCTLMKQGAGVKGGRRGKVHRRSSVADCCFYAGWKQNFNWRELLGSCARAEEKKSRAATVQSHLCHTPHNYSLSSQNTLFIISDWHNNCGGGALKPEALSRVDTMHRHMRQWRA